MLHRYLQAGLSAGLRAQVVWANGDDHAFTQITLARVACTAGQLAGVSARGADSDRHGVVVSGQHPRNQPVAKAHEVGHVQVDRCIEQLGRRTNLLHTAIAHDHHSVGQRERLFLVVGHVDRGGTELGMDASNFLAHFKAQLGVQVRQRLVHQHQKRLHHDGACDGHTLLLASRQLAWQLVLVILQPHQRDGLVDASLRVCSGHATHAQSETNVVAHRHVRKQCVVLEHHAKAPFFGLEMVNAFVV